ncbi:MAG: ribonuclease H-like domain-containing protein [Candidatus Nanohaloarchaeota archaeon QJJ-5]|nr:ribonuclease H-like domain-containing protein [Candidatus Nanohaloarchaeota archaeon QJJ-5]
MLRNSFSFLDGIGTTREQRLWEHGITEWRDFIEADDLHGIGDSTNEKHTSFLQKAQKNLEARNRAFFNSKVPNNQHWRMFREFRDSIAYLDIETTGLNKQRNDITTIAIYDGDDARALVQGQDLTRETLQQELDRHDLIVTFNGKQFDLPFIKAQFPEIKLEHPHIDLMYSCRKIGLTGGLKAIEKELGIGRDDVDGVDGKDAIRLWKRYQRHDDEAALERLVEYNKKDVENLAPLLETNYRRRAQKVVPDPVRDRIVSL